MTNSDLKRLIKNAYGVEPSVKKTEFINKYRRRELNYAQMLRIQLQYMGPQMTAVLGYALAIFLAAAADVDLSVAKIFSALMPAAALTALTGLGKSSRYRMEEIEAASRFSLRMIKILRLGIIGIAGVAVMLPVSCILKMVTGADPLNSFALAGIPYLMTTFFCMLLIRKWHSEKNIYGCAAIAVAVCVIMLGGIRIFEACPAAFSVLLPALLLPVSIILTVTEAYRYITESEELQWNLC